MSSLKLYKEYRNDQKLRDLFFGFTPRALYGADFRQWYLKGAWGKDYQPYSLANDREIVANVSFSAMDLFLDRKPVKGAQLATVGTLPEYRNRGLARQLMEMVLEKCEATTGLIFLFANESVMDFYPKFGFEQVDEYLFQTNVSAIKPSFKAKQLRIQSKSDFELITHMAQNRLPVTKVFGSGDYGHILLWHLLYIHGGNVWYLPEDRLIVIAQIEGNVLHLYDILNAKPFSFETILPKVLLKSVDKVVCYFTPELLDMDFQVFEKYTGSPLFVRGEFPLKNRRFKFPALAQT